MIPHLYILLALAPFALPRRHCGLAAILSLGLSVAWVGFGSLLQLTSIDIAIVAPYMPRLQPLGALFALLFCFTVFSSVAAQAAQIVISHRSTAEIKLHLSFSIAIFWALIGVLTAKTTFQFLLYWELMSIISFLMLMWRARGREFLHSAVSYFIAMHAGFFFIFGGFMSLGSSSLLFGVGTMSVGTWLLFFIGFGLKSAIFPLHFWLPSSYRAAGSMTASIFSGAVTNIGLYGIIATTYAAIDVLSIGYILMFAGAAGTIFGAVKMIGKNSIRGVLSYSSIENIGIIVMAIGLGFYAKANGLSVVAFLSFTGALVHIFAHGATKSLLFLSAGRVELGARTSTLTLLGGVSTKMPVNSAAFCCGSLSLTGVVPFGGFVGEFFILSAMLAAVSEFDYSIVGIAGVIVVSFAAGSTLFNMAKLFGFGFLGRSRSDCSAKLKEKITTAIVVAYALLGCAIIAMPWILVWLFTQNSTAIFGVLSSAAVGSVIDSTIAIVIIALILVVMVVGLYRLKKWRQKGAEVVTAKTWSCAAEREQFSAPSAESWSAEAISTLTIDRDNVKTKKISRVALPAHFMRRWTARLAKLQTGRTSHYVLHILLFLILILILTLTSAI